MANLTNEQIENIKNYNEKIESKESFIEAVQTMPTMYIGHISEQGFLNMFREIFQNSIDEVMRSYSPCDHIWITVDERSCTVIVEDNGRGIPFNNIERVYTYEHTSSNYSKEKGSGEYTAGTHGVGSKVTNALSSKFVVESYVLGEARRVEFNNGEIWDKGELVIPNPDDKQGTMIAFCPNFDIMGNISLSYENILRLIKDIVPLTVIGTTVSFNAIKLDGTSYHEEIINTRGIKEYLDNLTVAPFINIISFADDNGTTRANILMTYDSNDLESEKISGFSNFCPCTGSHIDGLINAVTEYFRNYMNKIYLTSINKKKKNKLSIAPSDIKAGLRAVIDVAHVNPTFTGQAKEILSNDDMKKFVKELTYKSLENWSKNNPTELQKLCKRFKDIAEIRLHSESGKQKLSLKYKDSLSGLPGKFIKPATKNWEELIICEGDSAKGSMENHRDNATQGVFPIKGKIINCFSNTMDKVLANEEVRGILAILGGGYGKKFDISKVRFKRVIFATDADDDGSHISNLLLILFMVLMPEMIIEGRVYKVVPPLYSITEGKGKKAKTRYFFDRADYIIYLKDLFCKSFVLSYSKYDTKLKESEVLKFLDTNENYIYELEKVADTYHIDPKLLEFVLINRNMRDDDLIKAIKMNRSYRFLNMEVINGVLAITGPTNGKINTLFLNDRMFNECKRIIDIMDNNLYTVYKLNGVDSTIYDIMKAFEQLQPDRLQRYKGLGEMDGEELGLTTVYPDHMGGQRVLIRYTFEDAKKEIERMRYLVTKDKNEMLKDLKVSRYDILG